MRTRTATSAGRATILTNSLQSICSGAIYPCSATFQVPWYMTQCRSLADGAAATKNDDTASAPQEVPTFSTSRVKDLYERLIALEKDEVSVVGELVLENLDLTVDPDEFYFHGIGKSGGGKAGGAAASAEVVEEVKKDKFDLKLVGYDEKSKIKVIKEVRSLTGLGLKEAKELVESAPKIIQKSLKTENAEELKATLEALGAQIELV